MIVVVVDGMMPFLVRGKKERDPLARLYFNRAVDGGTGGGV